LHIWIHIHLGSFGKDVFGFCAVEPPPPWGGGVGDSAASRRGLGRVASWKFAARKPEEP